MSLFNCSCIVVYRCRQCVLISVPLVTPWSRAPVGGVKLIRMNNYTDNAMLCQ